jgi:ferredoxin-NADP reductase
MPVPEKLRCRVDRVVDHGDRVYTVSLRPTQRAPRFSAGQFLHLALDPYDASRFWPDSRAFSIASSPSQRELLRISYAVKGRFTVRMEAEVVEGRDVWIKMPYGNFVVDPQSDAVLFAGGTGITAFTAFIESLTPAAERSVVVVYGARSNRLFIYRDVVDRCAQTVPAIDVSYFVEHEEPTHVADERSVARPRVGRVSVDAVWPRLRRVDETDYYISGPPGMLQTIGRDLRARGITDNRIHIDAWE